MSFIPPLSIAAAHRYVDENLSRQGLAVFRLGTSAETAQYVLALDLTRYAAWRAGLMSPGCVVEVERSLCSCHGYTGVVRITSIPVESLPDDSTPDHHHDAG
jgi:hypothetical protein